MANIDAKTGLAFKRMLDGSNPARGQRCVHVSGDSVAIFLNDAVKLAGDADAYGYPVVAQCAAGDQIYGICTSVEPVTFDSVNYAAGDTQRYVTILPATPQMVFEIQEDSVGGSLALTDVGKVVDLIVASGSTTTGYSGMEIDSSSAASGSSAQLRLLGIDLTNPDNAIGENARWEVTINELTLANGNNGVA